MRFTSVIETPTKTHELSWSAWANTRFANESGLATVAQYSLSVKTSVSGASRHFGAEPGEERVIPSDAAEHEPLAEDDEALRAS